MIRIKIKVKKLTDFFDFNLLDFKKTDYQSIIKRSKNRIEKTQLELVR